MKLGIFKPQYSQLRGDQVGWVGQANDPRGQRIDPWGLVMTGSQKPALKKTI